MDPRMPKISATRTVARVKTPTDEKRTVPHLRVVREQDPGGRSGGRPKNTDVRSREWLTEGEVDRLAIAARKRGRHGARDAFAIRFCARHGFRASELVELRWDAIDLDTGILHVIRKKNGVPSVHPLLGPEIRELRRLQREGSGSRYVFTGERGPVSRAWFQRLVERAGVKAGFAFPCHPHMLRHACGFKCANEGKDTRSLQLWLGHKSIVHTAHYATLSAERFKDW
jgi:type 1 fimbriae regulatory protein FimE